MEETREEQAVATYSSWPQWRQQLATWGALQPLFFRGMLRGRSVRTVLLAGACGKAAEVGLAQVSGNYNPYAHKLLACRWSTSEEVRAAYTRAVNIQHSGATLGLRRREHWMTVLVAVRGQSQYRSLAPSMVMDHQELPEKEKQVLRWIGQQVSSSAAAQNPEDERILVQVAVELLEYEEAAWEVLRALSADHGRLGRDPRPWSALLNRVQAARELAGR